MIATIRSTSARSSGPNSRIGEALLFSTGSPNLTTLASAASRRSSSSASIPPPPSSSVSVSAFSATNQFYGPLLWVDVDRDRDLAQGAIGGEALDGIADGGHGCLALGRL